MKRTLHRTGTAGLTLLEVVLALTLGAVIFATLGRVLVTSTDSLDQVNAGVQFVSDLKACLDAVGEDIRRSNEAQISVDKSPAAFDIFTLRVRGEDGGSPAYGAEDETGTFRPDWSIRYTVSSGDLVRQIRDGGGDVVAERLVAQHVDGVFEGSKAFEVTQSGALCNVRLRVLRVLKGGNEYRRQADSSFLARN
mgnify:CR=1 FL=1